MGSQRVSTSKVLFCQGYRFLFGVKSIGAFENKKINKSGKYPDHAIIRFIGLIRQPRFLSNISGYYDS